MKKNNDLPVPTELRTIEPVEFKGLTIREIRYRRALVALQKEFCKEKFNVSLLKLQSRSPFSKNYMPGKNAPGRFGAIAGKLFGGLNYLDYAVLGFDIFSALRKISRIFRHKK